MRTRTFTSCDGAVGVRESFVLRKHSKLLISFGAKICLYSGGTGERMAHSTDVAIMRVHNAKSPHPPPPPPSRCESADGVAEGEN